MKWSLPFFLILAANPVVEGASIGQRLFSINRQAGEIYEEVSELLPLTDNQITIWSEQALVLAQSGWHGWEAACAFMSTSAFLFESLGFDGLMQRCEYAVSLSEFSSDPAISYLQGIHLLLKDQQCSEKMACLEALGQDVKSSHQHANQLLANFFTVASQLALAVTAQAFTAWCELGRMSLYRNRQAFLMFLKTELEPLPLIDLHEMSLSSKASWADYLDELPLLRKNLSSQDLCQWQAVFSHFAGSAQDLKPLLQALVVSPPRVIRDALIRLLMYEFTDTTIAACFLSKYVDLPVDQPDVIRNWISKGHDLFAGERKRLEAFFSLESAAATDYLEVLRGQVNFDSCKRILQLYAEAMAGFRWAILSAEDEPQEQGADYRFQSGFDGLTIILPGQVNQFSSREANFLFYKHAVLHQLGYHQWGTLKALRKIDQAISTYPQPRLAAALFARIEAARIDWRWQAEFPGTARGYGLLKQSLGESLRTGLTGPPDLFEQMLLTTLDEPADAREPESAFMVQRLESLRDACSTVFDTLAVLDDLYSLLADKMSTVVASDIVMDYRRTLDIDGALVNLPLFEIEGAVQLTEGEDLLQLAMKIDPAGLEIEEMKRGDVDPEQGMMMTDLDEKPDIASSDEAQSESDKMSGLQEALAQFSRRNKPDRTYLYDEWDFLIEDYRRRWCKIREIKDCEMDLDYFQAALRDHRALLARVRRQLDRLKPELLVKIKGVAEGDEIDLERAVEATVDRLTGNTPSERIYVQRQRKGRDVAALFLVDMSASTDDSVPDSEDESIRSALETAEEFDWADPVIATVVPGTRIIDIEKQAVILMAEALEALGDSYAVCGFSGYGRDQVEYYLCKDFDQALDHRTKARIGGIKPCRSTRMGPAIRHSTQRLTRTESRIKALIIISDGYPQDHDYGRDRNSKAYGVNDTMKALYEAKQQGVQTYCLTVDPSGHDYLRQMCPDRQYMVIQDVHQLPDELSKVYRSLTG